MRYFIPVLGIVLLVLVFFAGCSDSEKETAVQTTLPTLTPTPTTMAQTTTATPTPTPTPKPTPDPLGDRPNLETIKTITGMSGTQSVNVTVPNGYWEMWYTAEPLVTGGQDSHSATGTNSAVFPSLAVIVRDAVSGDEIETVEPPGGLDVNLWQRSGDPRPWSKKFFQGNKAYIFDITARHLKSYIIEVRVQKQ